MVTALALRLAIAKNKCSFSAMVHFTCIRPQAGFLMMSISHSDLMPIRTERSDARLSQCETVIGIRQEFWLFSLSSRLENTLLFRAPPPTHHLCCLGFSSPASIRPGARSYARHAPAGLKCGHRGVADLRVPLGHRQLAGQQRRARRITFIRSSQISGRRGNHSPRMAPLPSHRRSIHPSSPAPVRTPKTQGCGYFKRRVTFA
jgi:hypothetical protein